MDPQVIMNLTNASFKDALVYMIVDSDLPLAIVERPSFRGLIQLLNEDAMALVTTMSRGTITLHISRMFRKYQHKIKRDHLAEQFSISFTLNTWTAPNLTTFMAVTAHYIDENFKLCDLAIRVPHGQGDDNGKEFAELFHDTLNKYSALDMTFTIIADDTAVDAKMARELELRIPEFSSSNQILRCPAHVINLAAKIGLAHLGFVGDTADNDGDVFMAKGDYSSPPSRNPTDVGPMTPPPDGTHTNAQTIMKRLHGLTTWVRSSPERHEQFSSAVESCQPEEFEEGIKCFEQLDVSTRWTSTFLMLQRAVLLEKSYTQFCQQNPDLSEFILSAEEWSLARVIMELLEPLRDVTEMLCKSTCPTLSGVLPVCLCLIKRLLSIRDGLNENSQLIQPVNDMIQKINQYLTEAILTPTYICAMILDPRLKLAFWKRDLEFILDQYNVSTDQILEIFTTAAREFSSKKAEVWYQNHPSADTQPSTPHPWDRFLEDLFPSEPEVEGIDGEIERYLEQNTEMKRVEVLPYWAARQQSFPILGLMARQYLSVPATSTASERLFSRGSRLVSSQQSSVKPKTIEHLFCLKDWFRIFGGP